MRLTFFFFSLLIISCSTTGEKEGINESTKVISEKTIISDEKEINKELTFEETQDSLRTLILNSKSNKSLKSSILQELYIRGLVNQTDNKIKFELPFDLHGFDCGAPDCYSTDITFEITAKDPIEFPEKINFKLFEHGCVDQEKKINSIFRLSENSTEHINYYSKELKSNLIIKKNGQIYFYQHGKTNSISLEVMDKMFKNNEFDEAEIVPFQSTIMLSDEYESF